MWKRGISEDGIERIAKKAQEVEWGKDQGPYYVLFGLTHTGEHWQILAEDFDMEFVDSEKEEMEDENLYEELRIKTFSTKDDAAIDHYLDRVNKEEKRYIGR